MTVRLGTVQRIVLLLLADGTARSVSRMEMDTLIDGGRIRGALDGLGRRGYVDRDYTSGDRSGDRSIQWSLSAAGQALAEEVHGLGEHEADAPRCPHGVEEGLPCKACRVGPWRCNDCGDVVRGGQRAPHRREAHDDWRYRRSTFTWAG